MNGLRKQRPMERRAVAKKKAAEQDPEVAHWEDFADELPDLPSVVAEFREIADDIKVLESRKKELAPVIEAAVVVGGLKGLTCGGYKIVQVSVEGRKQVAPERIVEKAAGYGLSAEQITEMLEYATVRAPGYTYPLVTRTEE